MGCVTFLVHNLQLCDPHFYLFLTYGPAVYQRLETVVPHLGLL